MSQMMNNFTFNDNYRFHMHAGMQSPSISNGSQYSLDNFNPFPVSPVLHVQPNLNRQRFAGSKNNGLKFTFGSEDKSSIGNDSGYAETTFEFKKTRWLKMSESLLHKDVKKFLKMNSAEGNKSKEFESRKPLRQNITGKKVQYFDDFDSDNEFECNAEIAQKAIDLRAYKKAAIAKRMLMLCESVKPKTNVLNISGKFYSQSFD